MEHVAADAAASGLYPLVKPAPHNFQCEAAATAASPLLIQTMARKRRSCSAQDSGLALCRPLLRLAIRHMPARVVCGFK